MFATCVTSISCPVSQVFVLSFVFVFVFVSLYSRSMPSRRKKGFSNGMAPCMSNSALRFAPTTTQPAHEAVVRLRGRQVFTSLATCCAGYMDKLTAVGILNTLFPRCFTTKQLGILFEQGSKLVEVSGAAPGHTWDQSAFVKVRARACGRYGDGTEHSRARPRAPRSS
jgi:hypothetical protein